MKDLKIRKGKNGQYFIYLPSDYIKNNNLKDIVFVKIDNFSFPKKIFFNKHQNISDGLISISGIVILPKLIGELLFQKDNKIEVVNYEEVSNS